MNIEKDTPTSEHVLSHFISHKLTREPQLQEAQTAQVCMQSVWVSQQCIMGKRTSQRFQASAERHVKKIPPLPHRHRHFRVFGAEGAQNIEACCLHHVWACCDQTVRATPKLLPPNHLCLGVSWQLNERMARVALLTQWQHLRITWTFV